MGLNGAAVPWRSTDPQLHLALLKTHVVTCKGLAGATCRLRQLLHCLPLCHAALQVTFVPDASVFSPGITFDQDTIASRLRELAFLNAGSTMKLQLLKHGQPLPTAGRSGSKAAKQSAAPADKAQRRSRKSTSKQEAAAAEGAGGALVASNGSSGGQAVAEQQDWQVFCFEEGLKEYVQW